MRWTERSEIPAASATMRPVQCVASPGGSPQVKAKTRCATASPNGASPAFLVLSRNSPSMPASA